MLTSIRKFSTSIYAKILLAIVIIPFVFWGMGSSFSGGNKNIVVLIDNEKYTAQEFIKFVQKYAPQNQKIDSNKIEELLSFYIGEKIIEKEVDYLGIGLSDRSLSKLLKHQKEFKRDNKFSRLEYEKFLLENGITAVAFEASIVNQERKKQFLQFISGGIKPPEYLINESFNKKNQKRSVQLINLNNFFEKDFNFTNEQVKSFYEKNKSMFSEIYKTVKVIELTPKKLTGEDEYNDIFFKKIDEIDDIVFEGENLNAIIVKYNLDKGNTFTINNLGNDLNAEIIKDLPQNVVKSIYSISNETSVILTESKGKYYIAEIFKTEEIERSIESKVVKKVILSKLKKRTKSESLSKIISKINQNQFKKNDFDELSNSNNLVIEKVNFLNQLDNKKLKQEIVNKIYSAPEKRVIVIHDINFDENYLVYIEKTESVKIDSSSEEYNQYINLSRNNIASSLIDTYDNYVKEKYKIDINSQSLEEIKNYFN